MILLIFVLEAVEVEILCGFFFGDAEVCKFSFCRDFSVDTKFRCDESEISLHLSQPCADFHVISNVYGMTILEIHSGSHSAGVQLIRYHPACNFIQQSGLDSTVNDAYPTLVVLGGIPISYDVISILIELELESEWIVWGTGKGIVIFLTHWCPRIDDFLHVIRT